jgi:cobalt/nickel transport system permease protein
MSNIQSSIVEMYALERLAAGETAIHRLHPAAKLLAALCFIVTVASFDRYALLSLTPFAFYPAVLTALSETSCAMLLKRFLVALPFCLFAGISNLIFDDAAAFSLGGLSVSFGVLSFVALLFRAYLCVTAVLLLIATTRMAEITAQLRRLRLPSVFVATLELTYRYVGVLMDEAGDMSRAYALRSGKGRRLEMRHMGSFVGQLILRSFDRAERIYAAMRCRGYTSHGFCARGPGRGFCARDAVFVASVCLPCAFFRAVPLGALLGAAALA